MAANAPTLIADRSATDSVLRAVVAAIERYRPGLDADEFLSAITVEVHVYRPWDDPRPGREVGDVMKVIVSHRSEIKPAR